MSEGDAGNGSGRFRYPRKVALGIFAHRPQKFAITAAHQRGAALHHTDGPIAQIVRFPRAIGDALLAKECRCDDAIGAASTMSVERAQSRAQALAFLPGEFMEGRSRRPPVYGAPQPSRCVRPRVEVTVKR